MTWLTPDAVDALERARSCARRSGIEDPAQDSLLATIRELQRQLVQANSRAVDELDRLRAAETGHRALLGAARVLLADADRRPSGLPSADAMSGLREVVTGEGGLVGPRREYVMAEVEELGGCRRCPPVPAHAAGRRK